MTKPVTFVIVDDDDGDAKAIQRAFQKANIDNTVIRAIDGVAALEVLRGANGIEPLAKPYILLVDINMPRMNGLELVQAIRDDENLAKTIIFMLTTSNRVEDKNIAYSYNIAGYILKYNEDHSLAHFVNMLIEYCLTVELPC